MLHSILLRCLLVISISAARAAAAPRAQQESQEVAIGAGVEDMMRAVDNVYVINLRRSADRWAYMSSQLRQVGVEPVRVEALDGALLSSHVEEATGTVTYYHSGEEDVEKKEEKEAKGGEQKKYHPAVGDDEGGFRAALSIVTWDVHTFEGTNGDHNKQAALTLSHLRALCMAYHNGDEVAMVLEDDVSFAPAALSRPSALHCHLLTVKSPATEPISMRGRAKQVVRGREGRQA